MSQKIILSLSIVIGAGNVCAADPIRPSPAQACAAYDVHVLTLLEDQGRAAKTTGYHLTTAMNDLVDARAACFRGDYDVGLNRYSRIDLHHPPVPGTEFADAH